MKKFFACLLLLFCIFAEAANPYPCPPGFNSCPWFTVWGYTGDYQAVSNQIYTELTTGYAYPDTSHPQTMLSAMPSNMAHIGWAFATGTCGSETWPNTPYLTAAQFAAGNTTPLPAAGKYYRIISGGAFYTFKCATHANFVTSVANYYTPNMTGWDSDIEGGAGYGGNVTGSFSGTNFNYTSGPVTGFTTLASGGTGYVVNDVLTVAGGTFTTAAQITVNSVSSGVIQTFTVPTAGTYTAFPAGAASTTGGTGTGATFNLASLQAGCVPLSASAVPLTELTGLVSGTGGPGSVFTTNQSQSWSGTPFMSCIGGASTYSQADVNDLVQSAMLAQTAYPNLRFTFNFGGYGGSAAYDSLGVYGIYVLNAIKTYQMKNYTIEVQTGAGLVDAAHCILYPDNSACEVGLTAIQTADNVHNWYGVPYNQIELNVANIGYQQVANNYLTLADICNIAFYAYNRPLAGVSLWSFSRDRDCPAGTYSDTCNGWGFAGVLGYTKTSLKAFGY